MIVELELAMVNTEVPVSAPTCRPRDLPLCDAILGSSEALDFLAQYVRDRQPELPPTFRFAALCLAFQGLDDFRSSGEANTSQWPTLYSCDTVIEFHYLLITVLSGYSVGLQGLADFSAAGLDKEAH